MKLHEQLPDRLRVPVHSTTGTITVREALPARAVVTAFSTAEDAEEKAVPPTSPRAIDPWRVAWILWGRARAGRGANPPTARDIDDDAAAQRAVRTASSRRPTNVGPR